MKTILLIDDNDKDIRRIRCELIKLGIKCKLRLARDGNRGLEILTSGKKEHLPDIVLIDVNVPKMNGFEFLRVVKSYHSFKTIKIYVTGDSFEDYAKTLVRISGAEGYLIKPFSFTDATKQTDVVLKLKTELLN